ncbi:MAG: FAD-dependent oxidoreductase, partial [Thermacetogeniaceae bacterium]
MEQAWHRGKGGTCGKTQVLIIGGGATGAGILCDLTLRGIDAVLVEAQELAYGTSGRCHGLLHSGGRYLVKDSEV